MKLKESSGIFWTSIANGDLRIASGVLTVLQTLGVFITLMDAPFSPSARQALGGLARCLFSGEKPTPLSRLIAPLPN
jgi:hypothetical protein